jgi:uncharacterized phage protein (TIGR02218 family)
MTFQAYENSNFDGIPVRLYEFMYGNTTFYYNSSDRDLVVAGKTYLGVSMEDAGFQQNGEPTTETLTVTCRADLDIVKKYRGTPPSETVFLTLRELHYDDSYASGDITNVPIAWLGEVGSCRIVDASQAEITANMLTISFKRGGLRLQWQRGCPHFVYDANCRVNKAAFAVSVTGTLTASHLAVATPTLVADGRFSGGFVEWTDPITGTVERRGIEAQTAQAIDLLGTIDDVDGVAGTTFTIYPGCKRTIDYCNSFFNNSVNYGGVPHLPSTSPFDGNPIY